MPSNNDFIKQTEAPDNQPARMMSALEELVQNVVGAKLITLMRLDLKEGGARRMYSSRPVEFPVSGVKALKASEWTRQVLDKRDVFVANTADEMALYFPDIELIKSIGCESCVNIPVVVGGLLLGTLNCLHEAGYYTPERIAAVESLKLPAAIILMASIELDDR